MRHFVSISPYLISVLLYILYTYSKFSKENPAYPSFLEKTVNIKIVQFYSSCNKYLQSSLLNNHIQYLTLVFQSNLSALKKSLVVFSEYILAIGIIGTIINIVMILFSDEYVYEISYPLLGSYLILFFLQRWGFNIRIPKTNEKKISNWIQYSPIIITVLVIGIFFDLLSYLFRDNNPHINPDTPNKSPESKD